MTIYREWLLKSCGGCERDMQCIHENCGKEERVWFPELDSRGSESRLHPWCISCGTVKNISDDKPKNIGHWMNVLSKISNKFSFSQCQRRLIVKDLQSNEMFNDNYGITGTSQKELFLKIINKHCNVTGSYIYSFLC